MQGEMQPGIIATEASVRALGAIAPQGRVRNVGATPRRPVNLARRKQHQGVLLGAFTSIAMGCRARGSKHQDQSRNEGKLAHGDVSGSWYRSQLGLASMTNSFGAERE